MKTIRMPQFTAENSIYSERKNYTVLSWAVKTNGSGVTPQAAAILGSRFGDITIEPEQCVTRCYWKCGRFGCYPTNCYEVCF